MAAPAHAWVCVDCGTRADQSGEGDPPEGSTALALERDHAAERATGNQWEVVRPVAGAVREWRCGACTPPDPNPEPTHCACCGEPLRVWQPESDPLDWLPDFAEGTVSERDREEEARHGCGVAHYREVPGSRKAWHRTCTPPDGY